MFQLAQARALQQRLVLLDGAADLTLLAIQIAENQSNLERIAGDVGGAAQLLDGTIDLVRNEEIESQHVVRRFPRAAPVDPFAVLELVAFPRLACGEADEQRYEHGERDSGF